MAHSLRSSGDLLVDRRFAYAQDLAGQDPEAAADLLLQTIERLPGWVPLWMALGTIRETQGRRADAVTAFGQADALDDTGLFGARLHLARLQEAGAAPAMPAAYVAALFDDYATRFDRHLVDDLGYRSPALLAEAITAVAGPRRFSYMVDLGCGTGLMGVAMRDRVDHLAGVDLSAAMIAEAARRGLYDSLRVEEIGHALRAAGRESADLVLAADVFVYLGALDIVAEAARVLAPDGLLAFTVQRSDTEALRLGPDLRYAHSADYVARTLHRSGLATLHLVEASGRRDGGRDVPGLVVVARKPA